MTHVDKETILKLLHEDGDCRPARELRAALLRRADDHVELARGERRALIRSYTIRLSALAEHGLSGEDVGHAIARLKAAPDDEVWLFTFQDETNSYIGIVNAAVTALVSAVVLPRFK